MKYKRIKDICNVTKGNTGIMKAISGEFPMVTLAQERKTNNEYQFDDKAVLIPLVSSTGHGHASMKRIHYQEGKFALGTILCALTQKNKDEYNPLFLFNYLDINKEDIFVPLMKGMANVSLPMNRIKEVEIPLPSIEKQNKLVEIFENAYKIKSGLDNEIIIQKEAVKKLRQTILQLAVQGKLTENWRAEYVKTHGRASLETGTQLLEKIKAEKEELIKQGKLKRQKPLPQIEENEKPFEIPDSWVWTRLVNIGLTNTGTTPSKNNPEYFGKDFPFVKPPEISEKGINYNTPDGLSFLGIEKGRLIPANSVLMVCIGGSTGKCNFTIKDISCNQQINTITPLQEIKPNYVNSAFMLPYFQAEVWNRASGGITPIINKGKWEKIPIPIPPLAEQKAIVSQVEKLLKLCDSLEKKITKSENLNKKLMQTIVKEYT